MLAFLTGFYGFLVLMGAFGPVSCWSGQSQSSTGEVVTTHGCEAGIDYLFGRTAGNAPVLFLWASVLLILVAIGGGRVRRAPGEPVYTTVATVPFKESVNPSAREQAKLDASEDMADDP